MKKVSISYFTFALIMMIGFSVMAQDKEAHKAMRQELRDYTQNTVIPVIQQQRLKLESQLSSSEKEQLATIRQELQSQREAAKPFRQEIKALRKSGEELSEDQKSQLKQLREEKRALMTQVKAIATTHEANIKGLKTEIESDRATWKTEMKVIRSKYISDEELKAKRDARIDAQIERLEAQKNAPLDGAKKGHGKKQQGKHKKGKKNVLKTLMSPVGFLLMDPNKPYELPNNKKTKLEADVHPNPASYQNKIEVDLSKNGPVKIELLDRQGNVLTTVLDEELKKGKHSVPVNTSTLPANVYYYRISSKAGVETKRFLISK